MEWHYLDQYSNDRNVAEIIETEHAASEQTQTSTGRSFAHAAERAVLGSLAPNQNSEMTHAASASRSTHDRPRQSG